MRQTPIMIARAPDETWPTVSAPTRSGYSRRQRPRTDRLQGAQEASDELSANLALHTDGNPEEAFSPLSSSGGVA
ncbi:MAG: hypothetical protein KatS3mg060_0320 [Dehalococcoidia bacterium]|nr:MAG: hypothetical protein KatS3mg060_0320 [Dehalococcoidia bacterium]